MWIEQATEEQIRKVYDFLVKNSLTTNERSATVYRPTNRVFAFHFPQRVLANTRDFVLYLLEQSNNPYLVDVCTMIINNEKVAATGAVRFL